MQVTCAPVACAKAQDRVDVSGGQGMPGHVAATMFLAATGVCMTHIPYSGPQAALHDVMGGPVPCGFLSTAVVML